jgi:hypothetical protein
MRGGRAMTDKELQVLAEQYVACTELWINADTLRDAKRLAQGYLALSATLAQREEGVANLQALLKNAYENNGAAYRERDALSAKLAAVQAERDNARQQMLSYAKELGDLRISNEEADRGEVVLACPLCRSPQISYELDTRYSGGVVAQGEAERVTGPDSLLRRCCHTCGAVFAVFTEPAYWQQVKGPAS